MHRRLMSTPARRRAVLVTLVLVAVGAALAYGLALTPGFVALLVAAGAVLTVWALAAADPARPRPSTRPKKPVREQVDPWKTATGRAVLDHMKVTNPWMAAQIEREGRDVVPDTPAGATAPGGAEAGFWSGLDIYGPGFAHGTVFVRTDPGGWDHDTWPAPACPECARDRGMSLMWLEERPDLARLVCVCGSSWTHTAWCRPAGTAWALMQGPAKDGGQVADSADIDPVLAYWGQMIRREAGNPGAGRNRRHPVED